MSEIAADGAVRNGVVTAGRLLREARQAQGLHVAALANAIKVTPRKLELLESDRLDELPDATFSRALAQTVCRSLKIDSGPVLALLPASGGHRLERLGEGLNTPFQERSAGLAANDGVALARPAVWGPVLLLLAAGAVYLMPPGWLPAQRPRPAAAAPAPVHDNAATVPAPDTVPAADGVTVSAVVPGVVPSQATQPLQLRVSADSWIDVTDAHGKILLSRLVKSGETVGLDGALPLQLKIGNAAGTEVVFRGHPLALAPFTRDNLARLELK